MLTILTIAAVLIAFVLVVVHWKIVREALLWTAAIASILAILAAAIMFILAIVYFDIALA